MACTKCGEQDISKFYLRIVNGKKYPFTRCKKCYQQYRKRVNRNDAHSTERTKRWRNDPEKLANVICMYSRRSDKDHDLENNLDVVFVKLLLQNPCTYCGDKINKKSLDRIDNTIGHVKSNVVICCMKCNYIRRDMPYEAWLIVAKSLKEIREKGLFDDWNPSPHKKYDKRLVSSTVEHSLDMGKAGGSNPSRVTKV